MHRRIISLPIVLTLTKRGASRITTGQSVYHQSISPWYTFQMPKRCRDPVEIGPLQAPRWAAPSSLYGFHFPPSWVWATIRTRSCEFQICKFHDGQKSFKKCFTYHLKLLMSDTKLLQQELQILETQSLAKQLSHISQTGELGDDLPVTLHLFEDLAS